MSSTPAGSPERKDRGTVLIAFVIYIATSLFIWFFTIPSIGLFDSAISHSTFSGNTLDLHLEYARDQAIQRKQPITICGSNNGLECSDSHRWTNGWIVFTDSDRNPGQFNSDDQLLYAYNVKNQELALEISANYVRYLANGVIELD